MRKKSIMVIAIALLVIVSSVTFGVVRQQKVEAERVAQQEKADLVKREKESLENARSAVALAYETRIIGDIVKADHAISKLSKKQEKEKKELTEKMSQLTVLTKQITEVNNSLKKTEKSKTEADVKATQGLIDQMKDEYLKKDKETAQKKLNKIKAQIKKEAQETVEVELEEEVEPVEQEESFYEEQVYQEPEYQAPVYQPAPQQPVPQPDPTPPSSEESSSSNIDEGTESDDNINTPDQSGEEAPKSSVNE